VGGKWTEVKKVVDQRRIVQFCYGANQELGVAFHFRKHWTVSSNSDVHRNLKRP
jgi:hypothetical protein